MFRLSPSTHLSKSCFQDWKALTLFKGPVALFNFLHSRNNFITNNQFWILRLWDKLVYKLNIFIKCSDGKNWYLLFEFSYFKDYLRLFWDYLRLLRVTLLLKMNFWMYFQTGIYYLLIQSFMNSEIYFKLSRGLNE